MTAELLVEILRLLLIGFGMLCATQVLEHAITVYASVKYNLWVQVLEDDDDDSPEA